MMVETNEIVIVKTSKTIQTTLHAMSVCPIVLRVELFKS
jgi:hypothetical protein